VNTVFYGKSPSLAKWLILPVIVGGVAISTLKPNATGGYSIEYDITALIAGSIGNMFAAFKGSENHKAMEKPGLKACAATPPLLPRISAIRDSAKPAPKNVLSWRQSACGGRLAARRIASAASAISSR
jgi:hypothetical protein